VPVAGFVEVASDDRAEGVRFDGWLAAESAVLVKPVKP
jgi:hypothetical protein